MIKPTYVLCKKTLTSGDNFYYIGFSKIERDNRMLVEGDWYKVVYNPNDGEDTFSIIDNQGHMHLHCMYEDEDNYDLPRNYDKWFYTIREMREMNLEKLGI